MKRPKYGNKKVTFQGIKFDSKREMHRYLVLKDMEKRGEIDRLSLQVPFILWGSKQEIRTPTGRPMKYVADFVYYRDGERFIEDSKGYPTPEYKIKKAILLAQGIEIIEV